MGMWMQSEHLVELGADTTIIDYCFSEWHNSGVCGVLFAFKLAYQKEFQSLQIIRVVLLSSNKKSHSIFHKLHQEK
jgi:hypothetical protein